MLLRAVTSRWALGTVVSILSLSAVLLARRGDSITHSSQDTAAHQHDVGAYKKTEIVGAKTPHLIPDAYAYRHFLSASSLSATHTAQQRKFVLHRW